MLQILRQQLPVIDLQAPASLPEVETREEVVLTVRHRRCQGDAQKVYAPKWHKEKLEGWFMLVGLEESDEVFCLKRMRCDKGSWQRVRCTFPAPEEPGTYVLSVYFISDSYLGLDQQFEVRRNVRQREGVGEADLLAGDLEEIE